MRENSTSNSPRTEPGQESIQVQIVENDNTRGILSFAETAVSVEENAGSVSLEVTRSGGTFGEVGVEFVVTGVSATGGGVDFGTDGGTVLLGMNVREADIVVNITNDLEAELEEVWRYVLMTLHITIHREHNYGIKSSTLTPTFTTEISLSTRFKACAYHKSSKLVLHSI